MKLFQSNADRLLGEYPWLWAVSDRWSSNAELRMLEMTDAILVHPSDERLTWWAYATWTNETVKWVHRVNADSTISLARMIWQSVTREGTWNVRIRNLVSRDDDGKYSPKFTIYRAPKRLDLHLMCESRG